MWKIIKTIYITTLVVEDSAVVCSTIFKIKDQSLNWKYKHASRFRDIFLLQKLFYWNIVNMKIIFPQPKAGAFPIQWTFSVDAQLWYFLNSVSQVILL